MTSAGVKRRKPSLSQIPISILSSVIWPSNDSLSVNIAVCTASSSANWSEYLNITEFYSINAKKQKKNIK